jgi:hypothetical protein
MQFTVVEAKLFLLCAAPLTPRACLRILRCKNLFISVSSGPGRNTLLLTGCSGNSMSRKRHRWYLQLSEQASWTSVQRRTEARNPHVYCEGIPAR